MGLHHPSASMGGGDTPPIAVLVSGGGRTLRNLAAAIDGGRLRARIAAVLASRECPGAAWARQAGLTTIIRPGDLSAGAFQRVIEPFAPALVVLAGYLRKLPMLPGLEHRVVNIHPALLPGFGGRGMYGLRVHEAVLAAGCRVSGCTVHLCDAEYDTGPIVAQACCPVLDDDTPERLAARVFEVECELYPRAISDLLESAFTIDGNRIRRIPA